MASLVATGICERGRMAGTTDLATTRADGLRSNILDRREADRPGSDARALGERHPRGASRRAQHLLQPLAGRQPGEDHEATDRRRIIELTQTDGATVASVMLMKFTVPHEASLKRRGNEMTKELRDTIARTRIRTEVLQAEATRCAEIVRRMEALAALDEWTMAQEIEWAEMEKHARMCGRAA